jgi:hypothetical protein
MLNESYYLPNIRQNGVADFIQDEIVRNHNFNKVSEKSIGDFFLDQYTAVNIKTMDLSKNFHMPNLVSAKKAFDFLSNYDNKLLFLFVLYTKDGDYIKINNYFYKNIEELSSTSIQAQGEGVLQLTKMEFRDQILRCDWIEEFKLKMKQFIAREEKKWASRKIYYAI